MKRETGYQYTLELSLKLNVMDELMKEYDLTWDQVDVFSALGITCSTFKKGKVVRTIFYKFMAKYVSSISKYKASKYIYQLVDKDMVWVHNDRFMLSDYGKKVFKDINLRLKAVDEKLTPLYKVLDSGEVTTKGDLAKAIPQKPVPNRKRHPDNPYLGVFRLTDGRWGAYIKAGNKEEMIGVYSRAIYAATGRDRYIEKHKLKLNKSLNYD